MAASREDMPTEKCRDLAATHVLSEDLSDNRRARWKEFLAHVTYVAVDATGAGEGWPQLARALDDAENKIRLFYLALPPSLYGPVCKAIGAHKLNTPNARIVLEKPIGSNFHTAREINDSVGEVFPENSIFRIDHYLGKETVQNLLILRFANFLFEPMWNANGIDHVQITVANPSELASVPAIMTVPARCVTWSRTTCSSWPVLSPWRHRPLWMPMRCAPRR